MTESDGLKVTSPLEWAGLSIQYLAARSEACCAAVALLCTLRQPDASHLFARSRHVS